MPGRTIFPAAYLEPTRGEPLAAPAGSMTIYDLLRKFCESARWASEQERRDAEAFIGELERVSFFGSLADTLKSKESDRNV